MKIYRNLKTAEFFFFLQFILMAHKTNKKKRKLRKYSSKGGQNEKEKGLS